MAWLIQNGVLYRVFRLGVGTFPEAENLGSGSESHPYLGTTGSLRCLFGVTAPHTKERRCDGRTATRAKRIPQDCCCNVILFI